ncbi:MULTISPECIES: transporter [unclassified Rhizobium]|uniref:SphA family protein n=1 Tax=unclassified Rhizobium TaxID=2613769 RepID=UPI001C82FDDE|nr:MULTISPECIES: transporter [unclassified Rhizobium]MBX5164922.1 transporter [Rhizobium sp. NZLR4b]MBX5170057.1 transporter [Rhizobium sp. NZLR1b]MBX5184864.1 transporter [Rhizobium sp. NZLR5]MBX5193003.1 transporter [Rhizobium sp. NZLR3b]MBX5209737.1 transporter [Rhizobium sp. NZLR11]
MQRYSKATTVLLAGAAVALPSAVFAAEGGAGFYLLGSKGPAAAITPPPGVYFQSDFYYYSGDLGGGTALPTGGRLAVGVEGQAAIEIPTVIWILPEDIAGGHLGLSATLPLGWKNADADVTLAGPRGGSATGSVSDDVFTIGDPLVSAFLGWEQGNFHWQVGTMINIPIGDYQDGEISNIAFHHWGADVFAAATWLDPTTGFDLSGVIGMTFNAENPATDYRTGNEFHFEWAAVQHFSPEFDAGLVGYYYDQVTGDSGDGAPGPFKGRVAAIGATIGWTFKAGEVPVSTRLKYFHEFAAENRAEGDAVFLTIAVPLSITKPTTIAAQ